MKSLADLEAIREKMKDVIAIREAGNHGTRIVVGMGTCGIEAGARDTLLEFVRQVHDLGLSEMITVTQTGNIEKTGLEPVVEIYRRGEKKVLYVHMTPDKVRRAVEELSAGRIVKEYTAE